MISIDDDVDANVNAIRGLCHDDLVVGAVHMHKPDFEFANFTLDELQEVSASLAGTSELSKAVRDADWGSIKRAKDLAEAYERITNRGLKGKEWGEALAGLARRIPDKPDTNELRQIVKQVSIAERAMHCNYDSEKSEFKIDPVTFQLVPRSSPPSK